jgi:hypothetical protein
MSWSEVFKINNNINKPVNKLILDTKYTPCRVINATTSYRPERKGLYRVICVGAGTGGGESVWNSSGQTSFSGGSAGGVAIKDIVLNPTQTYEITVSTTASFSNILSATGGTSSKHTTGNGYTAGSGGIGSGGDYNYTGEVGGNVSAILSVTGVANGGSVGVSIDVLSRRYKTGVEGNVDMEYGESILCYGAGGPAGKYYDTQYRERFCEGLPAAVIIIPLEMEE